MTAGERRFKRTTGSHRAWPVAPNIINQDFTASKPDEKWGADMSYVWTPGLALSGRRYRPLRTTGGRLGYR